MDKIKAGVIGYGQRGHGMLSLLLDMPEKVEITAICDIFPDRVEKAQKKLKERYGLDWKERE